MKSSVLVVEDDDDIARLVRYHLESAGFRVQMFPRANGVIEAAEDSPPAVFLLDIMIPGGSGLDLCRQARQSKLLAHVPIIFLTARGSESDRVSGLEIGADDYITKPFSLREVEARIKSVLRRTRAGSTHADGSDETPIVRGNLRVDPVRREVTIADRHVDLTPKEFDLLRLFASNPGRVFPRKYLLEKIWDYSYEGYDRTIDSHINRLRAKIEDNPENPQLVLTVWGIGYKFTDAE